MKSINMELINQIQEIKEKSGLSTKAVMEILVDTGVCKDSALPDVSTMDAILRGLEEKRNKKENRMLKKIVKSRKREEEIVSFIEQEAGCRIPCQAKEAIINELRVSYQLNGHISQGYIDNLIRAYRYIAQKKEAAILDGSATSFKS